MIRAPLTLAAVLLSGCVTSPQLLEGDIVKTHHLNVAWHEVRDGRIATVCAAILNSSTRDEPLTQGCHYWDGQVSHIFTPVVRTLPGLCTLGHEFAHSPRALGRFHDRAGNWIAER